MANLSLYNSHSQADNIFSMNICSSIWSVLFHAQFLILQWLCSRECADRFHNVLVFFYLLIYVLIKLVFLWVFFFFFSIFFPSCSASCQILDSVLMFCSVSPRFISFSIWRQFMQTSCRGKIELHCQLKLFEDHSPDIAVGLCDWKFCFPSYLFRWIFTEFL